MVLSQHFEINDFITENTDTKLSTILYEIVIDQFRSKTGNRSVRLKTLRKVKLFLLEFRNFPKRGKDSESQFIYENGYFRNRIIALITNGVPKTVKPLMTQRPKITKISRLVKSIIDAGLSKNCISRRSNVQYKNRLCRHSVHKPHPWKRSFQNSTPPRIKSLPTFFVKYIVKKLHIERFSFGHSSSQQRSKKSLERCIGNGDTNLQSRRKGHLNIFRKKSTPRDCIISRAENASLLAHAMIYLQDYMTEEEKALILSLVYINIPKFVYPGH